MCVYVAGSLQWTAVWVNVISWWGVMTHLRWTMETTWMRRTPLLPTWPRMSEESLYLQVRRSFPPTMQEKHACDSSFSMYVFLKEWICMCTPYLYRCKLFQGFFSCTAAVNTDSITLLLWYLFANAVNVLRVAIFLSYFTELSIVPVFYVTHGSTADCMPAGRGVCLSAKPIYFFSGFTNSIFQHGK